MRSGRPTGSQVRLGPPGGVRFSRVRPRDAATLVVTRGSGSRVRVLLGRRPPDDRFMPNVYVFPGGRVDASDARAVVERELPRAVARRLERRTTPHRARALAVAAVRETFEETGLVFGVRNGDDLRPDLSRLQYLARAITPALNPIRYHARFFHAPAEKASGRLVGNGELLDLGWYPIDRALGLPIIDVTEAVLEQLRGRLRGERPRDLFIHYRSMARVLERE